MFKKIGIIFFLIFLPVLLFSKNHICIQIGAYPVNKITSIYKDKKISSFISQRGDCIIDKRKKGTFYGVCCGDYNNILDAKKELPKFRKIFKYAFPRQFNPALAEEIAVVTETKPPIPKKSKKQKTNLTKKKKKIFKPSHKKKIAESIEKKEKEYDEFLTRNIVNAKTNSAYEIFSLKKYLETLKKIDLDFKSSSFVSTLFKVDSLIERDKYNPSIYFRAETSTRKTYNVGTATNKASLDAIAALHFDWHLYDAQKKYYMNERKIIFDRLSKLNLLEAQDRLMINGIFIYMNLWYLQRVIDDYNFLLAQQETLTKMIQIRKLRGAIVNYYEPIDSQNDLYSLQLAIADIKENYLQQEYIFRQSIDLMSKKPVYLYDPVYSDLNLSLKELQKEAVANNRELAKLQEEYKLSKSDIALAAAQKGLNLDFYSYAGYGGSTEIEGSNTDSGNGFEWQVGLRATYPIYNRGDIELQVERKKNITAQRALNVAKKIKTLTASVTKLYNSIKKLKYKEDIYLSQNKILKERLNISYNRFMKGEGNYKEYSDTLKSYTESLRQKLLNESILHASILQMYILTGRNLY